MNERDIKKQQLAYIKAMVAAASILPTEELTLFYRDIGKLLKERQKKGDTFFSEENMGNQ